MESGEAWIGPYYMGDFLWMHDTNPDLAFSIPHQGTNAFVDAMVVPRGAPNRENAELFINFMARTDIALMNMSAIMYSSANFEAAELYAAEIEPWKYAIMFPSAEVMDNTEVFMHLPQHILDLYDRLWTELKS
jgi:spermidine/putrescine transport system substrate-binding protein